LAIAPKKKLATATKNKVIDYEKHRGTDDHTVVGTVKVLPRVFSPQLENWRDILVYLPPSYEAGDTHYPVIYMHDGQNLFDATTSFSCEWKVDETLEATSEQGIEAIVVGIPNMGEHRIDEYSPFVDRKREGGFGDDYCRFIVETIKPRIDSTFRTLPDRDNTMIMGSSMGGLISLFAFFHYGHIFGRAGALSPSLWFAERAIFGYVQMAPFQPGKIYLDMGTEEGWPALSDARLMAKLLEQRGYRRDEDLCYVEMQDHAHCEPAWADRLEIPLRYLMGFTVDVEDVLRRADERAKAAQSEEQCETDQPDEGGEESGEDATE